MTDSAPRPPAGGAPDRARHPPGPGPGRPEPSAWRRASAATKLWIAIQCFMDVRTVSLALRRAAGPDSDALDYKKWANNRISLVSLCVLYID